MLDLEHRLARGGVRGLGHQRRDGPIRVEEQIAAAVDRAVGHVEGDDPVGAHRGLPMALDVAFDALLDRSEHD